MQLTYQGNFAKEDGFYVAMNYIRVESVEIEKQRVAIWVRKGGHGAIERRYFDFLANLSKVISICDNSEMFKLVMIIKDGEVVWKDKKTPNWLNINLK